MTKLISENLRSAVCEQIGHEMLNANIYLFMCAFLRNKGLDNIAKHFEEQHTEETGHAKHFLNLLTDLNADVFIPEVDAVMITYSTIMELANAYLAREIITTQSIDALKKTAIDEDNPVVEEKMREMITIQQAEYEEATTFLDKATLFDEWWKVGLWNESLNT